jgi:hypothetical protein
MGKAMLIIVLGFSMIFSAVTLNVSSQHARSVQNVARNYERLLARDAASSAANLAVSRIYRDVAWRDGYSALDFGSATASVQASDVATDPRTGVPTVSVTAVGNYFEVQDTVTTLLIQPAYSFFGIWLDHWPNFWTLTTGDTFYAPFHSNRGITISGTPVFYGRVSSDETWYTDAGSADPRFYGGVEFATPTIAKPSLTTVIDSAYAGGDVYTTNTTLVFNGDGTYNWYAAGDSGIKSISSGNGVILVDGANAYVRGVVDGQVTIMSTNDVFIEGSLRCAVSPEGNPASDDFIALLAQNDVIVADNAATSNGVLLHVSIAALGRFKVQNYDTGSPRGDLRLVGSLVVDRLDPFGTWSGGTLLTGYRFVHVYDSRLRTQRAPFFPIMTGWVEVVERVE